MSASETNKLPTTPMPARDSRWRSNRPRRGGNATLEMALVMPVLLAVAFGTVEFGQYLFIKNIFQSAARDGARAACLSTAVNNAEDTAMTRTFSTAGITYSTSWTTIKDVTSGLPGTTVTDVSGVSRGNSIQITVTTRYDLLPNVVRPLYTMTGKGIGTGKMVTGVCTMVKE